MRPADVGPELWAETSQRFQGGKRSCSLPPSAGTGLCFCSGGSYDSIPNIPVRRELFLLAGPGTATPQRSGRSGKARGGRERRAEGGRGEGPAYVPVTTGGERAPPRRGPQRGACQRPLTARKPKAAPGTTHTPQESGWGPETALAPGPQRPDLPTGLRLQRLRGRPRAGLGTRTSLSLERLTQWVWPDSENGWRQQVSRCCCHGCSGGHTVTSPVLCQ